MRIGAAVTNTEGGIRCAIPPYAGCEAADAVTIGDDVDSDINGAIAAGLRGILVRTGKYRPGDESRLKPSGVVVDDIGAATTVALR